MCGKGRCLCPRSALPIESETHSDSERAAWLKACWGSCETSRHEVLPRQRLHSCGHCPGSHTLSGRPMDEDLLHACACARSFVPSNGEPLLGCRVTGGHRADGLRLAFYPTLALATPGERSRFEINGSSVYWPDLDADIGADGLLAGAREHHFYARKAVERAVRQGRLPRTVLEESDAPKP